MKVSTPSILLVSAAWTVQAIPTAIPSSVGGRARGLPYNAVRSIHQSQRKLARQESTAAGNTPVPDVTSVLDIPGPTTDPLPSTGVVIVTPEPAEITSVANFPRQDLTSEPTAITSGAGIQTSEPLPSTTANVITSEPTAITSGADIPTSEPLPPTTTDVVTSEPTSIPQTFLVKVRQESVTIIPTQIATPIETIPEDPSTVIQATPTETIPVDSPTAVPVTPVETVPVESSTALPVTAIEMVLVESPTLPATPIIDTFVARSPDIDTASPPTTTS